MARPASAHAGSAPTPAPATGPAPATARPDPASYPAGTPHATPAALPPGHPSPGPRGPGDSTASHRWPANLTASPCDHQPSPSSYHPPNRSGATPLTLMHRGRAPTPNLNVSNPAIAGLLTGGYACCSSN